MRDLPYYLGLTYTVQIGPEPCTDGTSCYMARVVELPGCQSHGDSPEEARAHLEEAKALYLASMIEDGIEPPRPQSVALATARSAAWVWEILQDRPVGTGQVIRHPAPDPAAAPASARLG